MDDFARLVMEVDSSQFETADRTLGRFVGSADRTAASADRAAQSASRLASASGLIEEAVFRAGQRMSEIEKAAAEAQRALDNEANAARRAANELRGLQASADSLRATLDPLAAAQRNHTTELAKYDDLLKRQLITEEEHRQAVVLSGQAMDDLGRKLENTGGRFGLAGHQAANLRSQIIDIGTMLSMGASPLMILSSQAGQVYEALASGPGGVGAALKGIWSGLMSLVNPTTLVIAGLVAASAAARAFGPDVEGNVERAKRATDSFGRVTSNLKTAFLDVGGAIKSAMERDGVVSIERARREVSLLIAEQRRARDGLSENLLMRPMESQMGWIPENPFSSARELYRMGAGNLSRLTLQELAAEYENNRRSAASLVEELQKIVVDPETPKDLRQIADSMLETARQAEQAEQRVKNLANAIRDAKIAAARGDYEDASDAFSDFLPDDRTTRQQIQEAYNRRVQAIRQLQDNPRSMEGRLNTAEAQRVQALKELERQEAAVRRGRELDVESVNARTVAERALLAAERARLELDVPGAERADVESGARAAEARVYAEAERDAADAVRQSTIAREQAGLVGYAAQVAAINAQYQMEIELASGSADAVENLTRARQMDLDALAQSTRAAMISAQTEQLRLLQAEAQAIGLTDAARRSHLATLQAEVDLARQGVDVNSDLGREYVSNAQRIAQFENVVERNTEAVARQKRGYEDLRDSVLAAFDAIGGGESVMGSLARAFSGIGASLFKDGFDRLFGGILGQKREPVGALPIPSLPATSSYSAPHTTTPSYGGSAPLGAVARAPLPPLVTGEGFSASRAATVAGQSVPAQVWNFFAGKGLAPHQIAGIMGNARAESAFNPKAVGDNGHAFGLFQWNDRGPAMKRFVGSDWQSDVQGQLQFAWHELQTSESRAYRALLKATDVVSATEAFLGFERPSGYPTGVRNSHAYGKRVQYAQEAYRQNGVGGEYVSPNSAGDIVVNVPTPTSAPRSALLGTEYEAKKVIAEGTAQGARVGVVQANDQISAGAGGSAGAPGGIFSGGGLSLGVQAVGAGLGIFGQGYQSANPLMGGVSGALGGFQAGSALFPALGAAGPIGAVAGAALGILGGVLGGRQKRKQEHQEKAAAWEQLRPQYEAFDQSLSGEETGGLRAYITEQWGKLSEFMKVGGAAWKMGTGNSTAQFASTGTKLFDGFNKKLQEFRDGYESLVQDLGSGQGLQGAFSRGRAATRDLKKQIQATRDDVDIAFGNVADIGFLNTPESARQAEETAAARANAIERYNRAAGEYALSLMYSAETVSDVQKTIDGFKGTAAGLHDVFKDLGWSADEASRAIHERLDQSIANIARGLETTVADQVDGLSGRGYLVEVRSLLKEFDTLKADMALTGADTSMLGEFFRLSAQSIVDGSELAGSAFQELVKTFPQLADVVKEFSEAAVAASAAEIREATRGYEDRLFAAQNVGDDLAAFDRQAARERVEAARYGAEALAALEVTLGAERANIAKRVAADLSSERQALALNRYNAAVEARSEAESNLRQEYERTVSFVSSAKNFLSDMRLTPDVSILDGKGRLDEAQRLFRETQARAASGDPEAQADLLDVSRDYLEAARDYYATSEKYGEIYREIESSLRDSVSRADSQLDAARRSASFLDQLNNNGKSLLELVREWKAADDLARKEFSGVNANRDWGKNPDYNRSLVDALSRAGLNYTGNFGNGGFQSWLSSLSPSDRARAEGIAGSTPGAGAAPAPARDWGVNSAANQGYVAALAGVGLNYAGNFGGGGFQSWLSGLSPAQRALAQGAIGFSSGGEVWGPGTGTSDSILARLSNGEFVMRASSATSIGRTALHEANRTGALPVRVGRQSAGGAGASDAAARAIAQLQASLESELAGLREVVAFGANGTTLAVERVESVQKDVASELKRVNAG